MLLKCAFAAPPQALSSATVVAAERYVTAAPTGPQYRIPIDLLAFASDVDGDPLRFDLLSQPSSGLGRVELSAGLDVGTTNSGLVEYIVDKATFDRRTANPSFTYIVSEPPYTTGVTATVVVTGSQTGTIATVEGVQDTVWTAQGRAVVIDVLSNDTNAQRIHGTYPTTSQRGARIDLDRDSSNRKLVYTPAPGMSSGTDAFTYIPANAEQLGSATNVSVLFQPVSTLIEDAFEARTGALNNRTVDSPSGLLWSTSAGSNWRVGEGVANSAATECNRVEAASVPARLQDLPGPSFYIDARVGVHPWPLIDNASPWIHLNFSTGSGQESAPWTQSVLSAGLRFSNGGVTATINGPGGVPLAPHVATITLPPTTSTVRDVRFGLERVGFVSLWVDNVRVVNRLPIDPSIVSPYYSVTRVGLITGKSCASTSASTVYAQNFSFSQGEFTAGRLVVFDPFSTAGGVLANQGVSNRQESMPTGGVMGRQELVASIPLIIVNQGGDSLTMPAGRAGADIIGHGLNVGWRIVRPAGELVVAPGEVVTSLRIEVKAAPEAAELVGGQWKLHLADVTLNTNDYDISSGTPPVAGRFKATIGIPLHPGVVLRPDIKEPLQPLTRVVFPDETVTLFCGANAQIDAVQSLRNLKFDWTYNGGTPPLIFGKECREELRNDGNYCLETHAAADTWCNANRSHEYCEPMYYPDRTAIPPGTPVFSSRSYFKVENVSNNFTWDCKVGNINPGSGRLCSSDGDCPPTVQPVPHPQELCVRPLGLCSGGNHVCGNSSDCPFSQTCNLVGTSSCRLPEAIVAPAITILVLFVEIRQHPESRVVSEGASTTMSARVETTGTNVVYQWLRNNEPLAEGATWQGTKSPVLTIKSARPEHAGSYHLVVSAELEGRRGSVPGGKRTNSATSNAAQLVVLPENVERYAGDRFRTDDVRRQTGSPLAGARTEFGRKNWAKLAETFDPIFGDNTLTNSRASGAPHGADFVFSLAPYTASERVRLSAEFELHDLRFIDLNFYDITEAGQRLSTASASLARQSGDAWLARLNGESLATVTLSSLRPRPPILSLQYHQASNTIALLIDGQQVGSPRTVNGPLRVKSAGLSFIPESSAPAESVRIKGFWVGPEGAELGSDTVLLLDSFGANSERAEGSDLATTFPDRGVSAWQTRTPSGLVLRAGTLVNAAPNPGNGVFSASLPLGHAGKGLGILSTEMEVDLQHASSAALGLMRSEFGAFSNAGEFFLEIVPGASTATAALKARRGNPGNVVTVFSTQVPLSTNHRYRLRFSYQRTDADIVLNAAINGIALAAPQILTPQRDYLPIKGHVGFSVLPRVGGAVPAGGLVLHSFVVANETPSIALLTPPKADNTATAHETGQ